MVKPSWFAALSDALNKAPKSTVYTLATVNASASPPIPHVRSIVHRSFVLPLPNLPLLVSTTDVRTPKITELTSIPEVTGRPNAEIVWWIKDTDEQYRFSGVIHILPRSDHPLASGFPRRRLAPETDEDGSPFDWDKERERVFNEKMGPSLRASFARPTPGTTIGSYDEGKKWPTELPKTYEVKDGDGKTKAQVEEALRNFALLVMEPSSVERVELGTDPHRRTKYQREGEFWAETIVVP